MAKRKHINGKSTNGHDSKKKRRSTGKRQKTEETFYDLLSQGTRALERGRAIKATEFLEQAYEIDPKNRDLLLNLGGAYILSKQFKKAVEILEPLSERQPANPMVWTNLGAAYLGNPILATDEKQQRAIGAFKLALALDPKAPNVAYNLGLIYRDRKEYDEAIAWFEQALEANPNDKDAQNLIKQLSRQSGDRDTSSTEV